MRWRQRLTTWLAAARENKISKVYIVLLALAFIGNAFAADPSTSLESYGKKIASSTQRDAIKFRSVVKTTETPMRAYKLQFQASAPELMAAPNADKDKTAYFINAGKTEVWQAKFCTDDLKRIMFEFGIDLISGDLQDQSGNTQSLSVCFKAVLLQSLRHRARVA